MYRAIEKLTLIIVSLLFPVALSGQVTIGSSKAPSRGALLELNDGTTIPNEIVTASKGLGLPRVELQDQKALTMGSLEILDEDNAWKDHVGLMVYHIMSEADICERIPSGLYVWNGQEWQTMGPVIEKKPTKQLPVTTLVGLNQPNSYLVTEPSVVRIPIDKARKVWDGLSWRTSATDTPADVALLPAKTLDNLSVKLIWHDDPCGNLILNAAELSVVNDYIEVWVGKTKGNAVIALQVNDETVWSWHIWATDDPQAMSYSHTNAAGANYVFMDRNLGATSTLPQDINSGGMLYQWGRKDPFVTSTADASGNWLVAQRKIFDANNLIVSDINTPMVAAGQANLLTSISQPLSFITNTTFSSEDWYSSTGSQWNQRWGSASSKAVTDPCPEGWKVASFSGATNADSPWSRSNISGSVVSDYTTSGFNKGYNFVDYSDYNLGWYPAIGIRTYDGMITVQTVGKFAYLWTTSTSAARAKAMRLYANGFVPAANYQRANGFSVRCVKQ